MNIDKHMLTLFANPLNMIRYLMYYNKSAPLELSSWAKVLFFKEAEEWEKEYLPPYGVRGKTILDVGAGCGETAYFYFKHGAAKVICIEPNLASVEMIKRNAKKHGWNIEIYSRRFILKDMDLKFDFAKIDCEGGERILLMKQSLPPLAMEIHSLGLARAFKTLFPQMKVYQKYHWPYRTWFAQNYVQP